METESSLDSMETDSSVDPDDLAEVDALKRSPPKDLRFKDLRSADPTLFEEVKWLSRGDFIQAWHQLRFPEDAGDSRSSAEELLEHIQQSEEPEKHITQHIFAGAPWAQGRNTMYTPGSSVTVSRLAGPSHNATDLKHIGETILAGALWAQGWNTKHAQWPGKCGHRVGQECGFIFVDFGLPVRRFWINLGTVLELRDPDRGTLAKLWARQRHGLQGGTLAICLKSLFNKSWCP